MGSAENSLPQGEMKVQSSVRDSRLLAGRGRLRDWLHLDHDFPDCAGELVVAFLVVVAHRSFAILADIGCENKCLRTAKATFDHFLAVHEERARPSLPTANAY